MTKDTMNERGDDAARANANRLGTAIHDVIAEQAEDGRMSINDVLTALGRNVTWTMLMGCNSRKACLKDFERFVIHMREELNELIVRRQPELGWKDVNLN